MSAFCAHIAGDLARIRNVFTHENAGKRKTRGLGPSAQERRIHSVLLWSCEIIFYADYFLIFETAV